jgi:hypothetical protein
MSLKLRVNHCKVYSRGIQWVLDLLKVMLVVVVR